MTGLVRGEGGTTLNRAESGDEATTTPLLSYFWVWEISDMVSTRETPMIWISKICPSFYSPSCIAALRRDGWNGHNEGRKRDLKGHNYQSQEYVIYQ